MKLSIGIVIASILIIGLTDFSDATFLPWPPATCEPQTPKPPVKPTKPPVKPPKEPVKPSKKPVKPTKPPVKPTKPCNPPPCGPGGVACQGCPGQDKLCQQLIQMIRDLDTRIKQCVCGVKYV